MDSTLVQLIKQYEAYKVQKSGGTTEDSLADFMLYLTDQMNTNTSTTADFGIDSWQNFNRQTMAEMGVSYLGKMNRYVENYCRKTMPKTQVPSIDEFTYLILLLQFESLTKTELIHHNGHPITTGTEIIKRLLKKEFISQFDDATDKRSVRVKLTDAGRVALFSTASATKTISSLATGILSDQELISLVNTLRKLDEFHDRVFREGKQLEVEELAEKFLPGN
jgi:DNA-binding MarR family transcriptional regulator